MKSPRRNKSLEALARSVNDSEQFVAHVCNVAAAYSSHRTFDAAAFRDVRQALKTFAKHAEALSQWLQSSTGGARPEGQALRQIGVTLHSASAIGESTGVRSWLLQMAEASSLAAQAAPATVREAALRNAADGLRATFERHGLKISQRGPQQQHSDAVRLLCAIVNVAGTNELEPAQARQWFKSVKTKPARQAHKPPATPPRSKRRTN